MNEVDFNYDADVVVVGAGPAGCANAISLLLYGGKRVVLIERGDFNTIRVGEQVSPSFLKYLDYLKVNSADFGEKNYKPCFHSVSFWGSHRPIERHSVFTTEHANYQIDRELFELSLIKKVSESGGIVLPRTTISALHKSSDGFWHIQASHAKKKRLALKSKFLVDATGRNSGIARRLNLKAQHWDRLTGIGFFLKTDNDKDDGAQVIESVKLGWWYSAPLPHNQRVICFFTDADIASTQKLNKTDKWLALLAESTFIKFRLTGTNRLSDKPWVKRAHSRLLSENLPAGYVPVGEASCSFDPISSMGIGFALASGSQAATAITASDHTSGDMSIQSYSNDIKRIFSDYLKTRNKIYCQEQRWPNSAFWQRRTGEILSTVI